MVAEAATTITVVMAAAGHHSHSVLLQEWLGLMRTTDLRRFTMDLNMFILHNLKQQHIVPKMDFIIRKHKLAQAVGKE
jgi:hypothetical protein